jgi:hypothetical protein
VRSVIISSPSAVILICDHHWSETRVHAEWSRRVKTQLARIVAVEVKSVLACCWSLEISVKDLTDLVIVVHGLLEDQLE